MKTLIITFVLLILCAASSVWANHGRHNHEGLAAEKTVTGVEGASCKDTINVKVNGLVCDFCARALEKVFGSRKNVSGINVDLDNGKVVIAMKSGYTIDNKTLTQLITDSGYNVTAINKGC